MRALLLLQAASLPARRGALRALQGMGCDLTVAVPDQGAGLAGAAAEAAQGLRVVPIRASGDDPAAQPWRRGALRRLLLDLRPEILQVEAEATWPIAAQALALAAKHRIPGILVASESVARPAGLFVRLQRNRALRAARGLAGINTRALALLAPGAEGAKRAVLRLAPTDLPVNGQPRAPDTTFTIGAVARLLPERGVDILFRAVARLRGSWELLLAGTGPEQEALEALAQRLGISARVTWLGGVPRERLGEFWPRLDCYVNPARSTAEWVEPTAEIIMAAMGRGIPVIGTECGAIPEVIGEAGIVVPENDPESLGLALERLQALPDERARLGLAGRRRVLAEFVDEALARKTLAFWREVASA